MEETQLRNMIFAKARNVIETGQGERLTTDEENVLKDSGGVIFVAYQHAVHYLDNKEMIGGKDNER